MKFFLFTLVLLLALWLLPRPQSLQSWVSEHWKLIRGIFVSSAFLIVCFTLVGAFASAITERGGFHDEDTVLSITAAFLHGQPLYPAAGASVEYGLVYGPATYFVYLPPMLLGAQRFWMYRLWVVLGLACTYWLLYATFKRRYGFSASVSLLGLLAIFISGLTTIEWGTKGDPWVLFFCALGLWAAIRLNPWIAAIVIGLSGAMLVDLKVTLLIVALLPCLILHGRIRGRFPALVSALLTFLLPGIPFLFSSISFAGFRVLLANAAHRQTSQALMLSNASLAVWLILPALALLRMAYVADAQTTALWLRRNALYLLGLVAAAVVAVVTGAKIGAGAWHCMAIAVPILWVEAEFWKLASAQGAPRLFLAPQTGGPLLAITLGLILATRPAVEYGLDSRIHSDPSFAAASLPDIEQDLSEVIDRNPQEKLQMGYSDLRHYNRTFVRSMLTIRGSSLFIDADARNEDDLEGIPLSPAILNRLNSCDVTMWIIPKDGEPFSMENLYFAAGLTSERYLYPAAFRQVFLERYEKVSNGSKYFDLWKCRMP